MENSRNLDSWKLLIFLLLLSSLFFILGHRFSGDKESKIEFHDEQIAAGIVSLISNSPTPASSDLPKSPDPEPKKSLQTSTTPIPTPKISPSPTPRPMSLVPEPSPTPTPLNLPTLTPTFQQSQATDPNSCSKPSFKNNEPLREVVINEIAWMGTQFSTSDEWIELKNNTNQEVDIACWFLISEDGTPEIKLRSKINAEGYYLLERTDDNTIKDIAADQIYTGALGNLGEILKLYDNFGNLQDVVGHKDLNGQIVDWSAYAGDNSTKSSMERKNSDISGVESTNWHTNDGITKNGQDAGNNLINGTPKARNSSP